MFTILCNNIGQFSFMLLFDAPALFEVSLLLPMLKMLERIEFTYLTDVEGPERLSVSTRSTLERLSHRLFRKSMTC